MKKTTKPAAKKTTKKAVVSNQPVIEIDITNTSTLDGAVSALIAGKLNAGMDVSCFECKFVAHMFANAMTSILNTSYNMSNVAMEMAACLLNELVWNNRPWYKKLMFWKKKPAYNKVFKDIKIFTLS